MGDLYSDSKKSRRKIA